MSHSARDRALSGSAVQNIMNPVRGYRDELKRRGQPVKDHLREHAAKIREIQQRNRELSDAAEAEAARQPFKLDRFKQAQPLVFEAKEPELPPRPFLKRGSSLSRAGAAVANVSARSDGDRLASGVPASYSANSLDSDDSDRGSRLRKPPVPRAHELEATQPHRERKDFLRTNARAVIEAAPDPAKRAPPSAGPTARELNPSFGHVPDYLFERKMELAERAEQRRRAEQPSECPPGMVLLSEAERVDSLARLKQNAEAVSGELSRMPLVIETQKATRRKRELEDRLAQLEEAIVLFSRPKVFVAADS